MVDVCRDSSCQFCKPVPFPPPPEDQERIIPLPDDLTDEKYYFIDDVKDVFIYTWLALGPERLSFAQSFALRCMPWEVMISTPLHIFLPTVIYYTPRTPCRNLPTGHLWAVLMTLEETRTSTRMTAEGVVFVCADQTKEPPNCNLKDLWDWALDETNCPTSMRFASLSQALRVVCPVINCSGGRKDGYFPGARSWKVAEWDKTVNDLMKENVQWFSYSDPVPDAGHPRKVRKNRNKRRRTAHEDPEKFIAGIYNDLQKLESFSLTP